MDARRYKRIIVNIQAELICGDTRFTSFIENLSEEGMYVIAAPTKSSFDFIPGTPGELRFKFPSGEKMHLHCKVRWSYNTPPHGLTTSIGLEITDPPLAYKEFLKTFQ